MRIFNFLKKKPTESFSIDQNFDDDQQTYTDNICIDEENGYEANKKAMAFEKSGNIEKAIELYEESINYNFDGNSPYDRLAILYRKQKDYKNEIRVLNKAIDVFSYLKTNSPRKDVPIKLNKFKERLSKAIELQKNNITE